MAIKSKVKVKRKMKDMTATQGPMGVGLVARDPLFAKPTLAQQVQMKEMATARQAEMAAGLSATQPVMGVGEVAQSKSKVAASSIPEGSNIYDERIGGYGQAMPKESGEAAVKRIMKSKVKKKKAM